MRQFLMILFVSAMIPYISTLVWTGRLGTMGSTNLFWKSDAAAEKSGFDSEPNVIIERDEKEYAISVEEFLVHVLAAQISADFEPETLKAQAIIARTYIYGILDAKETMELTNISENQSETLVSREKGNGQRSIREEELDMDALSTEQMKSLWGEKSFVGNLVKLETAVEETDSLYLIYEGSLIEPLFCYASAGKTRSRGEQFPYLKQAESPGDLLAENFRSLPVFELGEFTARINEIPGSIPTSELEFEDDDGIQIVERDGAGYVKQIQIGQKTYTGEAVQCALGLSSPCYSIERLNGKIRVICKGVGHGYGFAQFGANEMAKEGKNYEELLNHYFQNVEIVEREV